MLRAVFKAVDRVSRSLSYVSLVFVYGLVFLMTFEVIRRYAFNAPSTWGVEISQSLQLGMVFFSVSWVLLQEKHINMELFLDMVNSRARHWMLAFGSLVSALFCGTMTYYCWAMAYSSLRLNEHSTTFTAWPLYPVKFIAALGFLLFTLQFLSRIYKYVDLAVSGRRNVPLGETK